MKKIIVGTFLGLFIVGIMAVFFRTVSVSAHTEHSLQCLCHNYIHNPHEVCSDNNSYKVGHYIHLGIGFDILGRCPIPSPTPTPIPPTPTPTPITECEDCVTPTPIPMPTETPRQPDQGSCNGCGNQPSAFMCPDGKVLEVPKALFVFRSGEQARITWFRTEGNRATILYRTTGYKGWEHALRDIETKEWNDVTIGSLNPKLGYDFGIYQHNNCGDGTMLLSVVVDGPKTVTYSFSFWEVMR